MPKGHVREELVKAVKMGDHKRVAKLKNDLKTGKHFHTQDDPKAKI